MDLKHHDVKYKRWIYLTVTFVIILAGLASRKYGNALPKFIAEYIGDTLWAAMVYWGLRFLFPSASILKVTAISLLFSYCIEISQLYQVDWANAIRNTPLGALVFGHGFLWSDMICYTVGVMLSATVDSCASFSSSDEAGLNQDVEKGKLILCKPLLSPPKAFVGHISRGYTFYSGWLHPFYAMV